MSLEQLNLSIPHGWVELSLRDVTSKVGSGATPRGGSTVYLDRGIPLIRSQNVHDNEFVWEGLAFLSEESSEKLKNVELHGGDVLLNITGDSILRCCCLPDALIGGRVNQHVAIVRSNGTVLPLYLQKWLSMPSMKKLMLGFSSGGTRKAVTQSDILGFPIAVPPLMEQRAIAATLGALDDKIESNSRAMRVSQKLGNALFYSLATETVSLSEIASITMGTSPKGETLNENGNGISFYQGTRDFDFRYPRLRVWTTNPKRFAEPNDTLLSVRAPVGDINRSRSRCCIGRGIAAVHSDSSPSSLYYAMRCAKSTWDKYQGEGTVFASVTKADVHAAEVLWPKPGTQKILEKELSSLDNKIESLCNENESLASLRDALLPELMSGRIRVPEAREVVQEATDMQVPEMEND